MCMARLSKLTCCMHLATVVRQRSCCEEGSVLLHVLGMVLGVHCLSCSCWYRWTR